jgi:dihydrolipoamide dehydrogenase
VRALRDRFIQGPIKLADSLGERSVAGKPRFLDANTIEVNGERITADATVVATGTRPIVPASWRELGRRVLTSDDLFEQPDLARRVAVVGLGGIGTELGQALADLGLEVHGYTQSEGIAGIGDPAVNAAMLTSLRRNMTVSTDVTVDLEAAGENAVQVNAGGESRQVDWVLAALGRRPNLDGLGLENLGLELDERGMPPMDPQTLQLGDMPIYIAGDVNGQRPLMHEAADEGRIAAYHALNPDAECLARRAPLAIVFTRPNAARVGLGYPDLPADSYLVGEADFSRQPRALMNGENEGCLRVYVETETGRLLGAEMAVPQGEHLAHLLAWSIQQGMDVDTLLQMPYYHPVVEEGLRTALQGARRQMGERRSLPDLPLCGEAAAWALGGD